MTDTTDTKTTPATTEILARLAELRPLAGRTAVVTGATSGIGEATARQFAAAGASVALIGRRGDRLASLSAELQDGGATVTTATADLAQRGAAAELAASVREAIGPVDLVVANAGIMLPEAFDTADQGPWNQMLDINVRGLLETGQAFVADLLAAAAEGRPADLVNIGSVAGHLVFPNYAVYGATKAAVAHLTRNLRGELGPKGVRVRTIEPGFTESELVTHIPGEEAQADLAGWFEQMGRITSHDIASAITWSSGLPSAVNVAEMVVLPTTQG